ncbi:ODA1, partial [Symbiodinium sp. KB8]
RTFKAAVAAEEKKAVALTKSIDQTRSQITALQAEMGGANAALESHRQIQKQTRILENRLDKALQKYNETLASNKALRRDIDSLRQERLSFERQYGRMDKELQGIKQQMADVIEAANEAYEIRDNAEFHAAEMRSEMERERAEFTRLLSEVEGRIAEEEARVRRMDEATKGALTASEEAQLQAELTAGERKVELTRAKVARAADKIAYYEEAFTKIRTATGITDIKQLVATFMRNEEENFSLFNFIAEQNAEIEGLEESLAALESDAVRAAKTRGAVVSADRGRLKPLLEEKQALEAATAALEGRFVRAKELVGSVCAAVQRCFAVVGCDEAAMRELVADGTVTAGNAMQFLGVIEQRVTEALQQYVS